MKNTTSNISKLVALTLGLGIVGSAQATDEPFNASMKLIAPIIVSETKALSFVEAVAGTADTVITAAGDGEAAIFTATGEASRAVTGSVVESSITMTTGGGGATEQITVDTFTTGGNLSALDGSAAFDGTGNLVDMRIGATANIDATDVAGDYTGSATFRLVYQ